MSHFIIIIRMNGWLTYWCIIRSQVIMIFYVILLMVIGL